MPSHTLSTRGSRFAAGSLLLLLMVALPLVVAIVEDDALQWGLFYAIALLAGCGIGWIVGDAFANSGAGGRTLVACGVLLVACVCFALPAYRIARTTGQFDLPSLSYALFGSPLQSGSVTGVVSYAAITFLLTTLIAAVAARGGAPAVSVETSGRPPDDAAARRAVELRYAAMTAWGTVGSAAGTGVAVLALGFALVQLAIAENRWQKEVTIRAISDENVDKPFASRHCLQALNALDETQLNDLTKREKVVLQESQKEFVRRCFADQDESDRKRFYDQDESGRWILKEKGSALLAQRVNYTLDKDGLIASLLKYRIGDRALVTSELRSRLCRYDKPLVERLNKTPLPDYPGTTVYSKEDSLLWLVRSNFCDQ